MNLKKRRIGRIIIKLFSFSLLAIVFLLIGSILFFYLYRNEISEQILSRTNQVIEGQITFKSISISPFKQFPDLSISLDDAVYYENKNTNNPAVLPIATLKHIYVSFNLKDLKERRFNVEKVLLNKGNLNLIRYQDSSLNLIKGTKIKHIPERLNRKDTSKTKTDTIAKPGISALFNQIAIEDVQINYSDLLRKKESSAHLDYLNARFTWKRDSLFIKLKVKGNINKQQLINPLGKNSSPIILNTETYLLRNDSILVFEKSNLTINQTTIHIYGGMDYKRNKLLSEISFSSNNIDLHFLDWALPKSDRYHLDSGSISFKGNVKGDLLNSIPSIQTEYIVSKAAFSILGESKQITDLNFKGYFDSGEPDDFSEALLRIDTISAIIPDGYIHGKAWVKNFKAPSIAYDLNLNLNLQEINDLLDSIPLSHLNGNLSVKSSFSGYLNQFTKEMTHNYSYTSIDFDSVSCLIGENHKVDLLDGRISGNSDTLCLDNLSCIIGNSDVLANGNIYNLKGLLLKDESSIRSDLTIESFRFHLIDLFQQNASIGRGFSYPIENINLIVKATTSYPELSQDVDVPTIHFDINRLDAEIVGLLPPVSVNQGLFTLGNKDSALYLDFKDVNVAIAGGEINADVVFAAPHDRESYVWVNGELDHINPGVIFQQEDKPINEVLNAFIDGQIETKLVLATEAKKLFHHSIATCENLTYYGLKDTLQFDYLQVDADTIAYNLDLDSNPLASLSSNLHIDGKGINTNGFQFNQMSYTIQAETGNFHIVPGDANWLGTKGTGMYHISPFTNPATFDVAYKVEQFEAEVLLNAVKLDSLMAGKIDLDFHLIFEGNNKEQILNSINGKIILKGNNLTYHGIDIDAVIEKLKRSQRFSLADVGAMMVAGPIGLAITKGSDYSRLLLNNGDATHINQLYTQWNLDGDHLTVEDLAFSTAKNRIAAKGWINPLSDSLRLDIAVLNPTGCSTMSQKLRGKISKPKISELKVFSSIVAPVTNLFEEVFSPDCEPFYEGKVKHPELAE